MNTSKNAVHKACMGCLGLLLLGPVVVHAQQRSIQQAQEIKLPQADVFISQPADQPAKDEEKASANGMQMPCCLGSMRTNKGGCS